MKITESQLRKTIKESIRKVLKENLAKETQTTNENTPMSEEETISVLEEHENELLFPFRLYVDRQMSVIQLYYTSINKADNALQQDLARKYKQIEKELPEWCPVIVNKPRIENNPNGTQDLIIDIEYDENGAKNFWRDTQ